MKFESRPSREHGSSYYVLFYKFYRELFTTEFSFYEFIQVVPLPNDAFFQKICRYLQVSVFVLSLFFQSISQQFDLHVYFFFFLEQILLTSTYYCICIYDKYLRVRYSKRGTLSGRVSFPSSTLVSSFYVL